MTATSKKLWVLQSQAELGDGRERIRGRVLGMDEVGEGGRVMAGG